MQTIEPGTQETILTILPDDYDRAMKIMCQLMANMMLSGNTPWDINKVTTALRAHLDSYMGI